jgi:hypothetical protein
MQTKTLFSSHYLDKRLPEHAEWAEDARPALVMERVRRTDWLIDQIVYRLYGLTEAEMAVVMKSW